MACANGVCASDVMSHNVKTASADRCVSSKYRKSYKESGRLLMLSLAILGCHPMVIHYSRVSLDSINKASAVEKLHFFISRYYRKCN